MDGARQQLKAVEGLAATATRADLRAAELDLQGFASLVEGHAAQAAESFAESLRVRRTSEAEEGWATPLTGLAAVAGQDERWEEAAALLGAVERLAATDQSFAGDSTLQPAVLERTRAHARSELADRYDVVAARYASYPVQLLVSAALKSVSVA